MSKRLLVAFSCAIVLLANVKKSCADLYDPPEGYYTGAIGTGNTLKGQLTTIMSTGHILRSYGNFRDSAAITDADPSVPGNILLVYNRDSVPATWDNGITWNREHTWPDSLQPQDANNNSTGAIADPHMLRPATPSVNSSRGNKPYGLDNSTGNNGAVTGGFYFPGDEDKGDMARTQFYAATRWSSLGFTLVEGLPSGFQMGDLSSLVNWNFSDVPDDFERHRNQAVYSQALNPSFYSNNRNAYVDHPEYVWSVFVDQMNDSQIAIDGGTLADNGGSLRNVDLGRVFVGDDVPATQSFALSKAGLDGTYYEVVATGGATSSIQGRFNAFANNSAGQHQISIGLTEGTANPGLRNGTVTINNLDVTTQGGAGRGANDSDDIFNVSLAVLDHAAPSFESSLELASLVYDFGNISQNAVIPSFEFDVFNHGELPSYTANLEFDSLLQSGDFGHFTTNLEAAAGLLVLAGGEGTEFSAAIDTATPGQFSATYTMWFSDEDLPGALSKSIELMLVGTVVANHIDGDFDFDGTVDAADYTVWRDGLGSAYGPEDYGLWKTHFGESNNVGRGAAQSTSAPEPTSFAFVLITLCCIVAIRRSRYRRSYCCSTRVLHQHVSLDEF